MEIKIVVTPERFDEVVDVDSGFYLFDCTDKEVYDMMVQFVVGEDGNYLSPKDARKLFKSIRRKELAKYITQFLRAVADAYVNPTNGSDSDKPPSAEPELAPDGSLS